MGLIMKKFNIFGVTEKPNFQGGSWKTNIEGGLPKKGGVLGQFADLRRAWQKRGEWCF